MNKKSLSIFLNDLTRGMLVPIYVLPMVGLAIAIGTAITNPAIVDFFPFLHHAIFNDAGKILKWGTLSVLINLHIIFAVGLSMGLAKKDKHLAGFNALILYFVYIYSMNTYMDINGLLIHGELRGTGQSQILGLQVVDTGIFVGMLIGILNAIVHNKYSQKVIQGAFALYGESRLVLLIMIPIAMLLGVAFTHIWPPVQQTIRILASHIMESGYIGVALYGFMERILIPTGLHHLLWIPLHFTDVGSCAEVTGHTYCGIENIFLAEMADPTIERLSSTVVYDARSLVKIFGLTGAGLAMYHCADDARKTYVKAILFPAIASSILVGVTEPIEFSFLFVAPILFVVHAILTGVFMMLVSIFDIVTIGKGGLIDFIMYNIPLGIAKTDWPYYILLGLVQCATYYIVFRLLIVKLNLKTPGRGDAEIKLHTKADYMAKQAAMPSVATLGNATEYHAEAIIQGLGGKDNITDVQNCYTRLRVEVRDPGRVDESLLQQAQPLGIVRRGQSIQIIFGSHVASVRQEVNHMLNVMQ
ncbi:PTS transporter subunit EIIC [Atlantibacter subterraneus]|uniref:PTS transporter subunit EIIC n=1 Tax=Atlantibacter subterraneus TaxID=255519 RepID=UPI002898B16C|nr:PTS transporter subunit EIIC [Atlantibacter subterranea]